MRNGDPGAGGLPRWWTLGIGSVVASGAFYVLSRTRPDPDLWGHVRFGQLMRELGRVPRFEPFSYLAERWINHEWLAEWIFGLAFDSAGTAGLVGVKVLVGVLLFGLVYRGLLRDGLDPLRGGSVAIGVLLLLYIGTDPVRPQLFTFLAFLLLLLALREAQRGRLAVLVAVPLLFVPWVNLHGGFLAGLGVIGVWTVARAANGAVRAHSVPRGIRAALPGVVVGIASLLACLANPYGFELLAFLLRTATVPRPEITEWRPIELASVEGLLYLGFLALVARALLRSSRPKEVPDMVVLGVMGILPLLAVRHLPLFALAGAVLAGPHIAAAFRRERFEVAVSPGTHRIAAALAGAIGLLLVGLSVPNFRCIPLGPPLGSDYPARAVGYLKASNVAGNLAVFFDWGEYAIWHLGPGIQVSMDGRRETVYPDSIYHQNFRFLYGTGRWDALLDDHPTDMALVPRGYAVYNLLKLKPGWEIVYEDALAALYARTGSEVLADLESTPVPDLPVDGAGLCFP